MENMSITTKASESTESQNEANKSEVKLLPGGKIKKKVYIFIFIYYLLFIIYYLLFIIYYLLFIIYLLLLSFRKFPVFLLRERKEINENM